MEQSRDSELDAKGAAEQVLAFKKSHRVALSWNQELKETALPDLKAHMLSLGFESISNKLLFMICLGFGVKSSVLGEKPARKSDSVRLEYLDDADKALFRTVALSYSKDFKILLDEDAVYDVVEQYASGGLEYLASEMRDQPNFPVWLIGQLNDDLGNFTASFRAAN